MNKIRLLAFVVIAAIVMALGIPGAVAQISVNIGVSPDCPYGCHVCRVDNDYTIRRRGSSDRPDSSGTQRGLA